MNKLFDIAADLDTPVSAFLKLKSFDPRFLLESVESGVRLARYSFIGFGPAQETKLDASGLWLDGELTAPASNAEDLLARLRQALAAAPRLSPDAPGLPFHGGLVGASSFDLVRLFEPSLQASSKPLSNSDPLLHYVAPSAVLVFDHFTRSMALLHDGDETDRQRMRREVIRALRGSVPLPSTSATRVGDITPSLERDAFCQRVKTVKDHILAGDIYQLVLSSRFSAEAEIDPFQVYRALRLLNPSSYMFYLRLGDATLVGASPEALVKLSGGQAQMRPIAGTRPRGDSEEADDALARELLADRKERAEHVMLVDLARNDLGRVAQPGSVKVEPFSIVERYSHVMHIVSGVEAALAPGLDGFDLFASAFPAGTLSGAPKVRALQLIDQLEPVGRGFYGGTVGYFGRGVGDDGNAGRCTELDQAITIRTLVFKNGEVSFQSGAGIVDDSDASTEFDEVLHKSAIMRRALDRVGEGL